MLLYHGTHSLHLAQILTQGILPRPNVHASVWAKKGCPSHPYNYLTDCQPFFYATQAWKHWPGWVEMHGGGKAGGRMPVPMIVEVDTTRLQTDRFLPDEDWFAAFAWNSRHALNWKDDKAVRKATSPVEIRMKCDLRRYKVFAQESLDNIGAIAYNGVIPPSAITRYCLVNVTQCAEVMMGYGMVQRMGDDLKKARPALDALLKALMDGIVSPELPRNTADEIIAASCVEWNSRGAMR